MKITSQFKVIAFYNFPLNRLEVEQLKILFKEFEVFIKT